MVELEQKKKEFEKQGLAVAALTYDSHDMLSWFANRKGITYPLLSDPDSETIRAFGILNENFKTGHRWYGIPWPGTYVIDADGVVRAKYFEDNHQERFTANAIYIREFGGDGGSRRVEAETPHIKLATWASDEVVHPGSRFTLVLEITTRGKNHVYAPTVKGYDPVEWKVDEQSWFLATDPLFPKAKSLNLPAIQETVPVYEGTVRLTRDVVLTQRRDLQRVLAGGAELTIEGSFHYQACDDKTCYPPTRVPLSWTLRAAMHDGQRAPGKLRR